MKKKVLCALLMLSTVSLTFAQDTEEHWRDSIATLLVNYFSSETWEDALKYVMEPERVQYLMELEYQDIGFESRLLSKEEIMHDFSMRKIKGHNHTLYVCKNKYYVVKTTEGYRIDWEASCYNPYSWVYIKGLPNKEFEVRKPLAFSETKDNWNLYGSSGASFWVKKNSTIDNRLFNFLKNGETKGLLLKIEYVTVDGNDYDRNCPVNRREGETNPYFTITEIVSSNYSKY